MQVKEAKFITSAATEAQFLRPEKPMIAVCGKSNVGKSTFINLLAGRKKLAKTSSEPGRTRLVNYFDFGQFWLADLPGYGYAAVSRAEKEKWAKTLDAFFRRKEDIAHVFALADIRHKPTADDKQMQALKNTFKPEFINRVDDIIIFRSLEKQAARETSIPYPAKRGRERTRSCL